jgi:hypothetical protein
LGSLLCNGWVSWWLATQLNVFVVVSGAVTRHVGGCCRSRNAATGDVETVTVPGAAASSTPGCWEKVRYDTPVTICAVGSPGGFYRVCDPVSMRLHPVPTQAQGSTGYALMRPPMQLAAWYVSKGFAPI